MPSSAPAIQSDKLLSQARDAFAAQNYSQAESYFSILSKSISLSETDLIKFFISSLHGNKSADGAKELIDLKISKPVYINLVIRSGIQPLFEKGEFDLVVKILRSLVSENPKDAMLTLLSARLFGELQKKDHLTTVLEKLTRQENGNPKIMLSILKLYNEFHLEGAIAFAKKEGKYWSKDVDLGSLCFSILFKNGYHEQALLIADNLEHVRDVKPNILAMIADANLNAGQFEHAESLAKEAIQRGSQTAYTFFVLARAQAMRGDSFGAIQSAKEVQKLNASHLPSASLLTRQQLKRGLYKSSSESARHAASIAPEMVGPKVDLARALKFNRQHEEAAAVLVDAVSDTDGTGSIARLAVSYLSKVGRNDEAQMAFDAFTALKRQSLPNSIVTGLKEAWSNADAADVPAARLEWAWQIWCHGNAGQKSFKKEAWLRRAKWGYLADRLLTDWLECNADRHSEIFALFQNFEAEQSKCMELLSMGRGLIIASAHLGPMYAGPLGLHLMGLKHRWLASTPALSSMVYNNALISTSDLSEIEVGLEFVKSIRQGLAVTIAVDGSINPKGPNTPFQGQMVRYSDFAARTIFKTKAPSIFATPYWNGVNIEFSFKEMPIPIPVESRQQFIERWKGAYFEELLSKLGQRPENLRLSGGIWRDIR